MAAVEALEHPIIGVRAWFLYPRRDEWILENAYPAEEDVPGLYSVTCHTQWMPGVNRAWCKPPLDIPGFNAKPCNNPPNILCNCGLYAYHNLEECMHNYNDYFLGCFGVVRGWGEVQCHPDGWRAQYAEVLALIGNQPQASKGTVQFWRPSALKYLAKVFEVPIVPFGAFPAMLGEFGKQVPMPIRPKPTNRYDFDTE